MRLIGLVDRTRRFALGTEILVWNSEGASFRHAQDTGKLDFMCKLYTLCYCWSCYPWQPRFFSNLENCSLVFYKTFFAAVQKRPLFRLSLCQAKCKHSPQPAWRLPRHTTSQHDPW